MTVSRGGLIAWVSVGLLVTYGLASVPASAATAGWMINGKLLTGTAALATAAKVDEKAKLIADGVEI
jgi:hypothetical protein